LLKEGRIRFRRSQSNEFIAGVIRGIKEFKEVRGRPTTTNGSS